MDRHAIRTFVADTWAKSILPALTSYIKIPNESPAYDPDWQRHGHMDAAVEVVRSWILEQEIAGLTLEVVRLPGRTPVILAEVGGDRRDTVLLYGHLDKQPPMHGWDDGLGPWTPVVRDGKLYGRGAADDGYAAFAAITAIKALQQQGARCAHCILLIEACEESGSFDLPYYINSLRERLGTPGLVVCLDSGCGNYEQLWVTSSLRGLLSATLQVSVLKEGVHSGAAGGIVPSSFRVLRQLLSRLEDECTGAIIPRALHVGVPPERLQQAHRAAQILGSGTIASYPFLAGVEPVSGSPVELLLNRTWRPQLEIIGAAGLPPLEQAGNVLRPTTAVKLSLRLPPTLSASDAAATVKELLEADPPYGAQVRCECDQAAAGWNAPPLEPWLEASLNRASREYFGADVAYMGEGGTIPFMAMLGQRFPQAQFVITGVLGPHANAHGPNEFLHLATAERLTACISGILYDHCAARCR